MLELLFSDTNFWFSIALVTVAILLILELISLIFGVSLIGILNNSPNPSIKNHSFNSSLQWLGFEQVPILTGLVIFLALFGSVGFICTHANQTLFHFTVDAWITLTIVSIISLATTGLLTKPVAKLLSKFHESEITRDDFVGAVAHITIGSASKGVPAEAKFTRGLSQFHYVLVEPKNEKDVFQQGDCVILIEKKSHYWLATRYQ